MSYVVAMCGEGVLNSKSKRLFAIWPLIYTVLSINYIIFIYANIYSIGTGIFRVTTFLKTKFPEVSLRFPGCFKLFPEQLKREKFDGVHLCL